MFITNVVCISSPSTRDSLTHSLRHLREFWRPASQSERCVAGGCHFNYPHAALGRWQASPHVPWSFFRSRHFCLLPPVDPQAAAGHGGRLPPSGSVWLLLAYRHPTLPIRCHQGSLLPVLDELPSESGLPSVKAGGGRACVIAEHAL